MNGKLDIGHTMMIRRELVRTEKHVDALIFLLSEAIQDEFVQCLTKAAATSPHVERKTNNSIKNKRCSLWPARQETAFQNSTVSGGQIMCNNL